MANVVFNAIKKYLANGSVDLDTDTIKVMLLTNAASPNIDSWAFRSDVTNEVTGTGYTAGGQALTTKTVTQDNTNDRAAWDFDDPAWTTATITARYAVYYKSRGGASSADELILCQDFGADISSTAGTFTIQEPASGALLLT